MSEQDHPEGIEELLAYLDAQFGERFDDERRDRLRERVADIRADAEALSGADLSNAEGPSPSFAAYRDEEE